MSIEEIKNIEKVAKDYISTRDENLFAELYKLLRRVCRNRLLYWSDTTYLANEHDITAVFDDTLYKTLESFTEGHFVRYFAVALKRNFFGLLRKLKTRRTYEMYESVWTGADIEDAATFDIIADDYNLEEEVMKTKKADQRKLIDSLIGHGQTLDAETTAIVKAFLSYEGKRLTANAIANQLGIHHTAVLRKLKRLAKRYDEQQFGDYQDYLLLAQ
ncbi:sigma-70 family RNA polymerase sigma factor [Priestia taiwanensis]|uniref:Uncharacterized protein n=1 Tax=Priestia taiwanensis TaxID=1347902 RepID=A0A917AXG2_9BACI|nr:sigma-70 family RNA polymerase sigma factor [Priestia taiwanensis]MBM7364582.1 DNA-directed RNA polymerase specialized sigma24 family protein [Priestia taiwanensis]GGE80378.1 hypothetical protein GCM10007140_32370 [Priestia taiwanensis]